MLSLGAWGSGQKATKLAGIKEVQAVDGAIDRMFESV